MRAKRQTPPEQDDKESRVAGDEGKVDRRQPRQRNEVDRVRTLRLDDPTNGRYAGEEKVPEQEPSESRNQGSDPEIGAPCDGSKLGQCPW